MTASYVPLWCRSNYSFLEGASHPDELLESASRLGLTSLGMADRDGVYGMVRAYAKARELSVQLLAGATVNVAAPGTTLLSSPVGTLAGRGYGGLHAHDEVDDAAPVAPSRRGRRGQDSALQTSLLNGAKPISSAENTVSASSSHVVLYAMDRAGWANLTRLLTAARRRCKKGEAVASWDEVCSHSAGVLALWGGDGSLLASEAAENRVDSVAGQLRDAFGDRLYALLTRHRRADEVAIEARARARAARLGLPTVAATEVLYHAPARRQLHDVLTCIRYGKTLATAGTRLRCNDEHALLSPFAFAKRWSDLPGAVARTLEVAARCQFDLGQLRYRYPSEKLPSGGTSLDYLRELAHAGAKRRYPEGVPEAVTRQLGIELDLIAELDYAGYFLTMVEIVGFCERANILCQGRGSAANSAVCFCLEITAVDPVRMGLLFERFLSRERAEPPDIDLDIEHERREEVIQYVYGKYGRDHAAMVCNIIRYRPRSAIRDVGRVLGIPATALDRAAKQLSAWGDVDREALARAGLGDNAPAAHQHLARLATELCDFPRHISIHSGGFLLGHEPVHDIVPIEPATMPGRSVIQWDKNDLETLGLFKLDLLALGALHQLHRSFDLIRTHRGHTLTMATIPADDPGTYEMICTADTVGVFQIESRAQMSMLPRLRPANFYDLVIEISLVRPGPVSGGMVHPYLRRRNGLEEVVFPHPCLEPVLARTLGVPLFQEQVMKLAVVAADYTPGEADQLRRDMAAWRQSGRIEQHRERLVNRMIQKGIAAEFAERVFEQIRGFGEYGFPEAHAASFALIAYATSYLRRHYLPEFTCALLNSQPMGFYLPSTIVADAQRHGLEVRPIDVNASAWDCTLERDDHDDHAQLSLRMGLRFIKGLTYRDGAHIVASRDAGYPSLQTFARRTQLSGRAQDSLAEAGAFGSLQATRRDALWQLAGFRGRQAEPLLLDDHDSDDDPALPELMPLDTVLWDYRTSSHSTRGHPLGPLRAQLRAQRLLDAVTVGRARDGQRIGFAGLVICRQRPGTARGVTFLTLEDETGVVNAVVWAQVFDKYTTILRASSLLGLSGRLQEQEGIRHLIVDHCFVPNLTHTVIGAGSRDFH